MPSAKIVVIASEKLEELQVLQSLPTCAEVIGIGQTLSDFAHLTEEQWHSINVLLRCGSSSPYAGTKENLQHVWRKLPSLQWLHTAATGVEKILFPELVTSDVVLTNARGCFSAALAEWAISSCLWFAKDLSRIMAAQKAHKWDKFIVKTLRGATLGILGYGEIGRTTARLAVSFGMRVLALGSADTPDAFDLQADKSQQFGKVIVCPRHQLPVVLSESDYVVNCLPHTPATEHFMAEQQFTMMQQHAVFINIGRGQTVDEQALIACLQRQGIRGAALDVFATEPLPYDSPLWDMQNVLLSAHTVDSTDTAKTDAIEQFVELLQLFVDGQPLRNIVDKVKGY